MLWWVPRRTPLCRPRGLGAEKLMPSRLPGSEGWAALNEAGGSWSKGWSRGWSKGLSKGQSKGQEQGPGARARSRGWEQGLGTGHLVSGWEMHLGPWGDTLLSWASS